MRIGILSDSHGHHERVRNALDQLQAAGAERFIHCGDVGGEAVLDAMAGYDLWFVWGNTDLDTALLERYAASIGLHPPTNVPVRLEWAKKHIHVYHGHERAFHPIGRGLALGDLTIVQRAADGADYIFHGHTHVAADQRIGSMRVINPGALYRVGTHTCCLLDLATGSAELLRVD